MKKINVFWASLGSALGLLLILYITMVWPKGGERTKVENSLNTLVRDLNGAVAETPGKPDIDGWKKYREEAKRAYKDITKFYADSDKALERWFPGMENPNRGSFMTKYRDEGARLEEELGKKGCQVGLVDGDPDDTESKDAGKKKRLGFNWEALEIPHWNSITQAGPEEEQKVLGELQKRYWARQRVANLVLTGGVKASRVLDFRFFKRLHPAVSNPPWDALPQAKEGITYQGLGGEGGNAFRGGFQEFDLPNELGRTLTFGAAIELPYSEVTKALREVLNPGGQPGANEPLLSLVGAHVTIRSQNEPLVTFEFAQGDKKDEADKREKALQAMKVREVLLTFTCQIIDFDPSKVKNFDAAGGQ